MTAQWQPIETAPKHLPGIGDFILLWNGRCVRPGSWDEDQGAWIDEANHDGWEHATLNATHWMPLPEPPTTEA